MSLLDLLKGPKKNIFWALIIVLLVIYLSANIILPGLDMHIKAIAFITNPFLLLMEKFVNVFLHITGSELNIHNHGLLQKGIPVEGYTTQIMHIKVTLVCLIIFWLTRANNYNKVIFTTICLLLGFISTSGYNVAQAFHYANDLQLSSALSTTHSLGVILMNTTLLIWFSINHKTWKQNTPQNSGITNLLENKLPDIIKLVYVYALILFSLGYFDFRLLIGFILRSSYGIVELLGYSAFIEENMLVGDNGSVSLYSACLGIMTMFLFVAVVYLTRSDKQKTWTFIIIGLVILNIANIIRIVLVFIHLQKYGDYMLAMDVHDLYNYATYGIVFILWVIWFEKFLNLRKTQKNKPE